MSKTRFGLPAGCGLKLSAESCVQHNKEQGLCSVSGEQRQQCSSLISHLLSAPCKCTNSLCLIFAILLSCLNYMIVLSGLFATRDFYLIISVTPLISDQIANLIFCSPFGE